MRKFKSNKGFTLLELLIYIGILTIVTVILASTLISINKGIGQITASSEVDSNIRFVLDRVGQDVDYATSVTSPAAGTSTTTAAFTSSNLWTAPSGVSSVEVQAWGGGGGGGAGGGSNGGSGGGGGAYAENDSIAVTSGSSYSVNVGAGGTGYVCTGVFTCTQLATNGQGSWFDTAATIYAAPGIAGIISGSPTVVSGGKVASSTGSILYAGGNSGTSNNGNGTGGGGGAGSTGAGGSGSATTAGSGTANKGGNGGAGATSGAGSNASTAGGGGGGGYNGYTSGGNGANGEVDISYSSIGSNNLTIISNSGTTISYCLVGGVIYRQAGGACGASSEPITSASVDVTGLSFTNIQNTNATLGQTVTSIQMVITAQYNSSSPDWQYSETNETTFQLDYQ